MCFQRCQENAELWGTLQGSCHSPWPKVPLLTWRGGREGTLSKDTGISKLAETSLLSHREGIKPQDGQNLSQGCCLLAVAGGGLLALGAEMGSGK